MIWQPIEVYDASKLKPKHAVFLFKAEPVGRMWLAETIETKRSFGCRTCTHFVELPPLPEPPKDPK